MITQKFKKFILKSFEEGINHDLIFNYFEKCICKIVKF